VSPRSCLVCRQRPRVCGLAITLLVVALAGCSKPATTSAPDPAESGAATGAAESGRLTIVMIPKATQHTFWNSVRRGAERAAEELDVNLVWKGPSIDNDRGEQKKVVQQFTNESSDGILLAPIDAIALAPEVRAAMAKKIPVLIYDSAVEGTPGKDFVSLVATDNEAAGRLGGKKLMELVGQGGKTVLFRHMEGHASTGAREAGALAEFKAANADVLLENRYSGPTIGEAQNTAMNIIDTLRQANGVFASNQTASEGMLRALEQQNLAGRVKFVGFDSSELLVRGLSAGNIDALVVQDPVDMGYQSVKLMVQHLKGEKIEPTVTTGVHLVTKENMNDPEIAPLIAP
jgi:ribose transport system substrate-binding protein